MLRRSGALVAWRSCLRISQPATGVLGGGAARRDPSPGGMASCCACSFALLPGAGCDPWIWHNVVPELQKRGHDAIGVRPPYGDERAGLPEYADAVTGAIGARDDVVLVAQSISGFVAPLVCTACRFDCSCSSTR